MGAQITEGESRGTSERGARVRYGVCGFGNKAASVAPTPGDDEAPTAQRKQRFTHRRWCYSECSGEVILGRESLACTQVAASNCPGEAALDEFGTASVTNGLKECALQSPRPRRVADECGVVGNCRTVFRHVSRFKRGHCSILAPFTLSRC
jgi:hypothetical protein